MILVPTRYGSIEALYCETEIAITDSEETTPSDKSPEELIRSSFAVKPEVLTNLQGLFKDLQLGSMAQLLNMLASNRAEVTPLLQPIADRHNATRKATITGGRRALMDKLKGMSPEQVERLLKMIDNTG